ncbi:ATP-binding cassette domain-containing protein [Azonexus sp.]|uniref:ATP-binding cassette domain-containing protein n=1 Tax=Azonexus sp. TaxID=1872668 RepID=UPI0027BAE177|nr:ATP-binding cassette domain-containing protein [Azonexus sp.]
MMDLLKSTRRRIRVPTRLQFQTTECGVATLAMILAHHGRSVPMDEIRRISGVSRDCMTAADMVRTARYFGLEAKAWSREPDNLENLPLPLVAHMNFIHFVVIEGMTESQVLLNDPAVGRSEISREEFERRFTGIVLGFRPLAEFQPKPAPASPLLSLSRRLRQNVPHLLGLFGLMAISGLLLAAPLLIVASTAQMMLDGHLDASTAWPWLLGALAGRLLLNSLQLALLDKLQSQIGSTETSSMLRKMLALPDTFFAYRLPAQLHAVIHSGDAAAQSICRELLPALINLPQVFVLLVAAWVIAPSSGFTLTLCGAFFALFLGTLLHWKNSTERQLGEESERDFSSLLDSLDSIESFKQAGMAEDYVIARLGSSAIKQKLYQQAGIARAAIAAANRMLQIGLPLTAVGSGWLAWRADQLSLGGWLAVCLLALGLLPEMQRWLKTRRKLDALHLRLLHVEDVHLHPPASPAPARNDSTMPPGAVRLNAVSFGYTETKPPFLKDLNLTIQAGEQVGISGPSGSGKSTLGGLLGGLHKVQTGQIRIGGDAAAAWVGKNDFFFTGTVRENLCLWQSTISDSAIYEALRDACIDDVIAARPLGLDTPIAVHGRNFSGGQRQRLEIARALLRNPALLVLDEATDALDPQLEARIRANIRRRGCTLIVISQRTSTLAACDRVLHIEAGEISSFDSEKTLPAAVDRATIDHHARQAVQQENSGLDSLMLNPEQDAALQDACQKIAIHHGQSVLATEREAFAENWRIVPTLRRLARANGMYVRRIRIDERRLWQQDLGPIIVFKHQTCLAETLFPEQIAALEAPADTLLPEAFCLYPAANLSDKRPLGWLYRAVDSARAELYRALLASTGLWAFALLPPLVLLGLLSTPDTQNIQSLKLITSLLFLTIASGLLELARHIALLRFDSRLESFVGNELAQRLIRIRPAFFRYTGQEQLALGLAGIPRLLDRLREAPLRKLLDAGTLVAAAGSLLWLDARLLPAALTLTVPAVLIPILLARQTESTRRQQLMQRVGSRRLLSDILGNFARLRLLGAADAALAAWQARHDKNTRQAQSIRRTDSLQELLEDIYPWFGIAGWLLLLLHVHEVSQVTLIVSSLVLWSMLHAALELGSSVAGWLLARELLPHTRQIMAAPLETQGLRIKHAPAPIELRKVYFGYPDSGLPVIENVSLSIPPGQIVVIAGPSGSGKSTLLRLLLGFETPDRGNVLYGGQCLNELDLLHWREQFGVVRQHDGIASASTLRNQIAGLAPVSLEEVWCAAAQVMLSDDIQAMPMGMQSIVEGNKISTGQEQRLLIARQLIRKPALLILDEATNALPEDIQAALIDQLRTLGITCVLVTHRESAIALADQVFILEKGRLAWQGAPQMLATQQGLIEQLRAESRQEGKHVA